MDYSSTQRKKVTNFLCSDNTFYVISRKPDFAFLSLPIQLVFPELHYSFKSLHCQDFDAGNSVVCGVTLHVPPQSSVSGITIILKIVMQASYDMLYLK